MRLTTLHQAELNGTAGAMLLARDFVVDENAFVFGWGDILMDAENYARFIGTARSRIVRPDALDQSGARSVAWRRGVCQREHAGGAAGRKARTGNLDHALEQCRAVRCNADAFSNTSQS